MGMGMGIPQHVLAVPRPPPAHHVQSFTQHAQHAQHVSIPTSSTPLAPTWHSSMGLLRQFQYGMLPTVPQRVHQQDNGARVSSADDGILISTNTVGSMGTFMDEPVNDVPEEQTQLLCSICLDNPVTHKLMPCSHAHFCELCASLLAAGAVSSHTRPECPLCRSPIDGIELATAPNTPPQVHGHVTNAPEVRSAATQLQNIANIVQRHRR